MRAFILLPFLWTFFIAPNTALPARKEESPSNKNGVSFMKDDVSIVSGINHQDVDSDFENGTIAPWTDCSEVEAQWVIENNLSWTNENSRNQLQVSMPPPPKNGQYFIWLKHDLKIFGIGILSSPYFIAYPGDEITFSYWLHSTYQHFNNIELFWSAQDQQEELKLLELFPMSLTEEQSDWFMSTVRIPIVHPTIGKVILYGFCDSQNSLGYYSIAIDDILLLRDVTSTVRSDSADSSTDNHFSTSYLPMTTTNSPLISETSKLPLIKTTTVDPNTLCFAGTIDFYPCACSLGGGFGTEMFCIDVPMIEVRDGFFSRMDLLDLPAFYLYAMDGDIIPDYLFDHDGISYINNFELHCLGPSLIEASPFAFVNNISVTINFFSLYDCNFENLNFLEGFAYNEVVKLNELNFYSSLNINETLKTLPDGFKTNILRIRSSNLLRLNLVTYPQVLYLEELRVYENVMIDDDTIDVLLNWILQTPIKKTLIKLYIFNNGLKRIPSQLKRFDILTYFRFDYNILESGIIKKGELTFYDYTLLVMLTNCGIHTIEAGAFQGVFVGTNIYLNGNNLTRFESDVYLPILEQMITYEGNQEDRGLFEVDGNPFDCVDDPCQLTWLLRDNNRTFLPFIRNAACANGTLFQDIQPDDPMFNDCP